MNPSSNVSTKDRKISPVKQNFSLPDSIVHYMTKNPATPKAYLKLAKSCKYFFEKHLLIIVKTISSFRQKFCEKHYHGWNTMKCCIGINDIQKLSCNIWLTGIFRLSKSIIPNAATLFSSKLYRCEDAVLSIHSNSQICFEDFKIWASVFQKYEIENIFMTEKDRNYATFSSVLAVIPNIHTFRFDFLFNDSAATASTIKDITKLNNLNNLYKLVLYNIPEIINVNDLVTFIKIHKNTKFRLDFSWNISDTYKIQLDQLVDNIIESNFLYCVIIYNGQDKEKYNVMKSHYHC